MKNYNSTTNQRIKEMLIQREVYCNVNSLIEFALSQSLEGADSPVSYDEIENFYSYPEYIGEHANFEGGTEEQRDEEIERLKEFLASNDVAIESIDFIETEIEELENLESEPAEIFEWWAISGYLCDKLKELGECVIDDGYNHYWGRCTSGQAILLDHCISLVAEQMEILEGMPNEWKIN